ncbi:hypothetical protein [Acidovorax sp. A1169]|jgi:hypothetical protein|uniref:hypothetical protein n=1 Tax=Acidovorax sp. A1169 TaxID=3059524 RepID=UPI002737917A|nr:hypothetical protein [Acidovorax sp. A1169]MDP4075993.1 hypothetical protein [Acidovorax sp. A1169]
MRISRSLLWLLLLTLCLHLTAGMGLHAAEHLGSQRAAAAQAMASDEDREAGHPGKTSVEAGVCAWCLAHAQQAADLATAPPVHGAAQAWARVRPVPDAVAFIPHPGHWPFASRDPPAAQA